MLKWHGVRMPGDTKTRGAISENGKIVLSIVQWVLAVLVLPAGAFVISLDRDVTAIKSELEHMKADQVSSDAAVETMSATINELSQGLVRIETTMTAVKETLSEVREELRDSR